MPNPEPRTANPEPLTSAPQAYSQLVLDEIERRNLFLIRFDDQGHWYRYHHLFIDVLRMRLMGGVAATEIRVLHQRASAWYQQQGLIAEAVQHVLASQDWDAAAGLIEQHGAVLQAQGAAAPGTYRFISRRLRLGPEKRCSRCC